MHWKTVKNGTDIIPGCGTDIIPGCGTDIIPGCGTDIIPGCGTKTSVENLYIENSKERYCYTWCQKFEAIWVTLLV